MFEAHDAPDFDAGKAQCVHIEPLDISVHESENERVNGTIQEHHPVHQPRNFERHFNVIRVVLIRREINIEFGMESLK